MWRWKEKAERKGVKIWVAESLYYAKTHSRFFTYFSHLIQTPDLCGKYCPYSTNGDTVELESDLGFCLLSLSFSPIKRDGLNPCSDFVTQWESQFFFGPHCCHLCNQGIRQRGLMKISSSSIMFFFWVWSLLGVWCEHHRQQTIKTETASCILLISDANECSQCSNFIWYWIVAYKAILHLSQ